MINLEFLMNNAKQVSFTFNDEVVLHDLNGVFYSSKGNDVFVGDDLYKKHNLVWNENYQFTKSDVELFKSQRVQ